MSTDGAIYRNSAGLYDYFSAHKNYSEASRFLADLIRRHTDGATSLLDVACGTGGHLQYLADHFEAAGLDQSEEMLELARRKCPNLDFYQGDLCQFDLGRQFDAITCLFGSIGYAADFESMQTAINIMTGHLSPLGILIIEPWLSPESYKVGTVTTDFIDEDEFKACRMYVSELIADRSSFDIHYLVADHAGVKTYREHHTLGLFSKSQYRDAMGRAGLEIVLDDGDLFGYGLLAGIKTV